MEMTNAEWDCLEQASGSMDEQRHTSQKKDSEMSKDINRMNAQWLQRSNNMSGTILKIESESKKELSYLQESVGALKGEGNLIAPVLEELTEMERENGKIVKDVTQMREELQSFAVALMAKGNSTASVLEELAAMKKENGRIAKDITQMREELQSFTVSVTTNRTWSPSVLEELAELKRENGRITKDVLQVLEELRNFTELVCTRCPENWLTFQRSCYFFSTLRKPWRAANKSCENEGGHLVIINHWAEQKFLLNQLANEQVFWIGLSDIDKEQKWIWVDGTPLSISFWGAGEPNDAGHGEDCATLLFNGKWNDAVCSSVDYWICERRC
ncbi:C-type lectin domain family 17, member A-like isoform X2 [Elgaria multicarinata webbii]|uniref:C-type lectin domain family 17, member A-like isoform X2 n=1 Tax=Elgaria multicarinata webbii TaxID=159646 RepID=UPI002FCD16F8